LGLIRLGRARRSLLAKHHAAGCQERERHYCRRNPFHKHLPPFICRATNATASRRLTLPNGLSRRGTRKREQSRVFTRVAACVTPATGCELGVGAAACRARSRL